MNWQGYKDIARALQKDTNLPREAALRTAISRAYYFAYNTAAQYARSNCRNVPRFQSHKFLIELFYAKSIQHNDKRLSALAKQLKKIRTLRDRADYDDVFQGLGRSKPNAVTTSMPVLEMAANQALMSSSDIYGTITTLRPKI